MKKCLAVSLTLMLLLSGCLGFGEAENDEADEYNAVDTDGDGIPDAQDEDDDGDLWSDLDELNCQSDPLDVNDVPLDFDTDWSCDVRDADDDDDGYTDIDETLCGTNPLDEKSVPSDMDNDGVCDIMDEDMDGDGVDNGDDFSPEDPDKWEGLGGCTDVAAFNYNEDAEVEDGTCFTLEDAEQAVLQAMAGLSKLEVTMPDPGVYSSGALLQITVVDDVPNDFTSMTYALIQYGEEVGRATYTSTNNGYIQVELHSENPTQPVAQRYLVSSVYEDITTDAGGMSHCESDGVNWYCLSNEEHYYQRDHGDDGHHEEGSCYNPTTHELYASTQEECEEAGHYWMEDDDGHDDHESDEGHPLGTGPNSQSSEAQYHQYECANGELVKVSAVNNGVEDCSDASDEPRMEADDSTFLCNEGSTVSFGLVNNGEMDCPDGSDEPSFIGDYWYCADGEMISSMQINNGHSDCSDGSDEPYYDMASYEVSMYSCEDGNTVLLSKVNDGADDCPDGTDEHPSGMPEWLAEDFVCQDDDDGTIVVPLIMVNDGKEDCPQGVDEPTYDASGTETSQFECAVFQDPDEEELVDIPLSSVNDGVVDCDLRQDEAALSGNYTDRWFGYGYFDDDHDDEEDEVHWESYNGGYCEWEGTGEDDERWWCKIDETDVDWENWWYYCENHGADWHCTDDFGQSETHENSADGEQWSDDGTDENEEICLFYGEEFYIPWSWVNDGIDDCEDGTDEPSYDSNGQENSTVLCDDGTEILLSKANDGQSDCQDGEDEYSWILEIRYTCENGETIDFDEVNDGRFDCDDRGDEPEYELEESTDFTCDDGTLIPFSKANNGEDDCSNAEDEPTYEEEELSTFDCNSGDTIPLSSVNDGQNDCPGGDDEPTYDLITQTETSTYTCLDSGEVIALSSVNDEEDDCDDGTDEPYYYEYDTSEFECVDGSNTLHISDLNNGHAECMDASDEAQYIMPEDEHSLTCNDGSQISIDAFNDGKDDCSDGSDEPDYFLCEDGWRNINLQQVNDGYQHCYDGSDEVRVDDVNIVECYGGEDSIKASQFHDGQFHCEDGWDEMQFEFWQDCEWTNDEVGWECTEVFFSPDATWKFSSRKTFGQPEMMYLSTTTDLGTTVDAVFDAATQSLLTLERTPHDDNHYDQDHLKVATALHDPTMEDIFDVDETLDVHAPPFALFFNGQPRQANNEVFTCGSGEEIPFQAVNDHHDDCADASDEPTYDEESYACTLGNQAIPMSRVNDHHADCADGSDEPVLDEDGHDTTYFTCLESGEEIILSWVNDNIVDCYDHTDEPDGYMTETSSFTCDDGDTIHLSQVNNQHQDCHDGSDELPPADGHGYGDYDILQSGPHQWKLGEGEHRLDVVFANCEGFEPQYPQSGFTHSTYLLPQDCGAEIARYSLDEIIDGDVVGLSYSDAHGPGTLTVDTDFALDGWNAVRLSTPSGAYADENPEVQLPAPGIGLTVMTLLGAAMLMHRRNE